MWVKRESDDLYLDQRSAVPSSSSSDDPPSPKFPIRKAPQSSVLLMSYQSKIECSGRCTVNAAGKVQRNAHNGFGLTWSSIKAVEQVLMRSQAMFIIFVKRIINFCFITSSANLDFHECSCSAWFSWFAPLQPSFCWMHNDIRSALQGSGWEQTK